MTRISDRFTPIGTRMCPSKSGYPDEFDRCEHVRIRNVTKRLRRRDRNETAAERRRRLTGGR